MQLKTNNSTENTSLITIPMKKTQEFYLATSSVWNQSGTHLPWEAYAIIDYIIIIINIYWTLTMSQVILWVSSFTHLMPSTTLWAAIFITSLWMTKLKQREVKDIIYGHVKLPIAKLGQKSQSSAQCRSHLKLVGQFWVPCHIQPHCPWCTPAFNSSMPSGREGEVRGHIDQN